MNFHSSRFRAPDSLAHSWRAALTQFYAQLTPQLRFLKQHKLDLFSFMLVCVMIAFLFLKISTEKKELLAQFLL